MKENSCSKSCNTIDRRRMLTRTFPACAAACLGIGRLPWLPQLALAQSPQDQHPFDTPSEITLTPRQRGRMQTNAAMQLIRSLRRELGDAELIRLLNLFSAERGRQAGEQQAARAPDRSFQTFVQVFRPPNMADSLIHEVVEDTEKVFGLEVRECLWADLFHEAGLGGEVGHAAVCNMDYYWPPAFNPDFKMERTKTLMQGHDICNHRYIDTS